MGHVIDKLGYNKAHQDDSWVIKEYVKALPMFQIMSSGRPFGQVDLDEVEKQAAEIERLKAEVQQLRNGGNTEMADLRGEVEELKAMVKLMYSDPDIIKRFKESKNI